MPKSRQYWQDRFTFLQEQMLEKGEDYYRSIEKQYRVAMKEIEKDINTWYARLANNNEISMAEAKQLLSARELKEFRWDVKEYIRMGEANAIDQKWMKQLENASARVHISRLEALKVQVQQHIEVLYGNQLDGLDMLARSIYSEGYYHTAFEIQRGFNVGWDLQSLDSKQLDAIVSKPWAADGSNFSDRIWGNKTKLVNNLHTQLTQTIIRGDSPEKAIAEIAEQMNVSKNAAGRLVMTESAFFSAAAQGDCFNSLDVERYEIIATLDSKTSEICRDMDGKDFETKDFEPGVTANPFHCWCRTTTAPYFDDNYGERIAKGVDGKTYYVPSDMTYKEWHEKFVKPNPQHVLKELKEKKFSADTRQYEKYKSVFGKDFPRTVDEFQNLKYNRVEEWNRLKGDYRKLNAYNKIIANEPAITADLKAVSSSANMDLVGLEYRVKSRDSYLRKVGMDSNNSLDPKVIDETVSSTNDVIRYTYQASHDTLVDKYFEVNQRLVEKGYKQEKMKNTWPIKANPYKGVNCIYSSPTGQKFEIQYHTPESFELKNGEMHQLYEKWRLIKDKSSSEAVEISKKMSDLSSKLKYPDKITELG